MKKRISLLLVAVMLLGLAACGAAKPAETQAPAPTAAPTAAPTEAPTETPTEAALVVDTCILKEADDKMLNTYTLLAVNPDAPFTDADGNPVSDVAVNTAGADALIHWLLTREALDMAGDYGVAEYGEHLFYVKDDAPVYTGDIAPPPRKPRSSACPLPPPSTIPDCSATCCLCSNPPTAIPWRCSPPVPARPSTPPSSATPT